MINLKELLGEKPEEIKKGENTVKIEFTYKPESTYVMVANGDETLPTTCFKTTANTSNDELVKKCEAWLKAFGLEDVEYSINVSLR